MADEEFVTPAKALAHLGKEMVAQDMSKVSIRAMVGVGILVGLFVRLYEWRKVLLRIAFVLFVAGLLSTGKGAQILEVLLK